MFYPRKAFAPFREDDPHDRHNVIIARLGKREALKTQGGMMEKRTTKEELLARAAKPARDAMEMHPHYRGKIEVVPKCVIRDVNDFAVWYTPGVAETSKDIKKNPEMVFSTRTKRTLWPS